MSVIDTEQVFKQLKKQNGEQVAKVIRRAVLLGVPNIVHLLEFAGNDPENIERLVPYIHENFVEKLKPTVHTDQDPITLLKSAHYNAFVVKTLKQQNSIKKYFRKGEELCTFRDSNRYKDYYMIHAVKENADKIQPFPNPQREDEYGTSVISIQISKDSDFISIKNRYNHGLKKQNPDATFNNNPDKIVPGLTDSLKKYFHTDFTTSTGVELPDNYIRIDNQLVCYNYELDNIYYSSDYYIQDGNIVKLNTAHQIMMDYIILDTQTKRIKIFSTNWGFRDADYSVFAEAFNGKNISIKIDKNDKTRKIISTPDGNCVVVQNGVITELTLPNTKDIGDKFLEWNEELKVANFPKLETTGDDFLAGNEALKVLNSPNLKTAGDNFLISNRTLESLDLPNLKTIGNKALRFNEVLESLNTPKLKTTGDDFLEHNEALKVLNSPNLKTMGEYFLSNNKKLTVANFPKLETIGKGFLYKNNSLVSLNAPKVKKFGYGFLELNKVLQTLNMPCVEIFVCDNSYIRKLWARTQLNNKQQIITNRQTKRNGR